MKKYLWIGLSSLLLVLIMGIASSPVQGDGSQQNSPTGITIEALSPDANVRSQPIIEAGNVIGQIQPGEVYPALGRYFEWVLIEFLPSPNQRAWVFGGVVSFTGGSIDNLPVIDPASIPPAGLAPTNTLLPSPTQGDVAAPPPVTTPPPPAASGSLPTFTPLAITPTPLNFATVEGTFVIVPEEEVERRLDVIRQVWTQPILLTNGVEVIELNPADVGFIIDENAMRAEINPSLRFSLAQTIIIADYSPELLQAYINDLAARYSTPAVTTFDANTLTFQVQSPGRSLDTATLQDRLQVALFSPYSIGRTVEMPFITENRLGMAVLEQAIVTYFNTYGVFYNGPDSVVSVYVEDLTTGENMGVQENILHSGTSTSKIGVIASFFRYVYQLPSNQDLYSMLAAVICSSNADANALIATIGNGDSIVGLQQTTDTFCRAGAGNSRVDRNFFIGPAGEGAVPTNYYDLAGAPVCASAAPLDTSLSFPIDDGIQTTAADMGGFLSDIYACANSTEGLALDFPGEITQEECGYMLEILSGTNFSHMTELGVPDGVDMAHKVGYAGQATGDAGIIYSPNGDYVLTIYMWDSRLGNFDSYAIGRWNIMGEVSRIVYNFFNPDAPLTAPQQPLNPNGGVACVLPSGPEAVDINDVNAGRFDEDGIPLPTACYDWPNCRPFDNWGQP